MFLNIRLFRPLVLTLLLLLPLERDGSNSMAKAQSSSASPASHALVLSFDPARTTIDWTLPSTLHTVHGTFQLKSGSIRIESGGTASGEIVVDAASAKSGNDGRDEKMHKEVLESAKYSDIRFRAEHVSAALPPSGAYTATLHGAFALHGGTHEMDIQVQANLAGGQWTGTSKFSIPYVDWGLKNPSNFFLKVQPQVQIELKASGKIEATDR